MTKLYKYVPILTRFQLLSHVSLLLVFTYDIINGGPVFWGWSFGLLFVAVLLMDVGTIYDENVDIFKKRTLSNIVNFFAALVSGACAFTVVSYGAGVKVQNTGIPFQEFKNAMFCLRGFNVFPFIIFFILWGTLYYILEKKQ